MHNLKEIRKNPANFKKKIEERNTKVSFDKSKSVFASIITLTGIPSSLI